MEAGLGSGAPAKSAKSERAVLAVNGWWEWELAQLLQADVPASPAAGADEGLEPMMLLRKLAIVAATSRATSRLD